MTASMLAMSKWVVGSSSNRKLGGEQQFDQGEPTLFAPAENLESRLPERERHRAGFWHPVPHHGVGVRRGFIHHASFEVGFHPLLGEIAH